MTTQSSIERAFRNGVRSVTDDVQITLLRDALDRGAVQDALEVIDIEPAMFDDLRRQLVQTYADAGAESTARLRGVRWNSASPRAEDYARNQVGGRITLITDDMRVAVRNTIADGYAFGRSPNRMALDLVGRIGPSGRREGGIVGLADNQAAWIRNMRTALETDPEAALRFSKRDRRFDRLLRSGKPLTAAQIDNITRSYSNRLLLSRGRTIAITERGLAINQGRIDSYKNAADKYGISHDRIVKTWVYTGRSTKERPTHVAANRQSVVGIDTPFDIGGTQMLYPHDPAAPASETVNCSCEIRLGLR